MKKLIATIVLGTFLFTSTFISSAFAANEGAAVRPVPGTAEETPTYEIQREEPSTATETPGEPASKAEAVATSQATNAYISGVNPKIIEGSIFVVALIAMSVAIGASGGGSSSSSGH